MLEFVTVVMAVLTCCMYAAKIMFGNTAMDVLRESGSGMSSSREPRPFLSVIVAQCVVWLCICLSVSVTSWGFIKMAGRIELDFGSVASRELSCAVL